MWFGFGHIPEINKKNFVSSPSFKQNIAVQTKIIAFMRTKILQLIMILSFVQSNKT